MNTTARQLVNGALKLIGVLDPIETASPEDCQDGLDKINDNVDEWNGTHTMLYATTEVVATFSTISATIGPGQTINVARPQRLEPGCFFRIGSIDYALKIATREQYDAIQIKSIPTGFPEWVFYDGGSPTGNVYVFPVPSGPMEFHFNVMTQLSAFADLDTAYGLPAGYRKALLYTLAEDMAPLHSREPSPTIVRIAAAARKRLKAANLQVPLMTLDSAIPGDGARLNILSNR